VTRIALVAFAVAVCLVGAAPAAATLRIGIGEQNPTFFDDPRWQALDAPYVRLVVPWDALKVAAHRAEVDAWMAAAEREGADPLVTFGHSRRRGRELHLPSRRKFSAAFRAFRKRFPGQRVFQVWNEANHGTQPTYRAPARAARYYDAMKRHCRGCTIAAPSVLDARNMIPWIKRFRAVAKRPVRIWSIHNHIDANRLRTTGTRELLRNTRGQVWFTETGGIVNRVVDGRRRKEYNKRNSVRATRQVFRLARMSRRVKRIYFYHWVAPNERRPRWDSAFIDRNGRERPALRVVRRELRRLERAARPRWRRPSRRQCVVVRAARADQGHRARSAAARRAAAAPTSVCASRN
jgi:hypothetical protein